MTGKEKIGKRRVYWKGKGRKIIFSDLLLRFGREVVWFLGGFLLGQTEWAFGSYSFGLGLICGAGGHTLSIFLGVVSATVFRSEYTLLYLCGFGAAAFIRSIGDLVLETPEKRFELPPKIAAFLSGGKTAEKRHPWRERMQKKKSGQQLLNAFDGFRSMFSESVCLRATVAAATALVIGIIRWVSNGYRFFDCFVLIGSVLIAGAVSFLISAATEPKKMQIGFRAGAEVICAAILVFAARNLIVWQFSISGILAFYFIERTCRRRGLVFGIFAGLLTGIAYAPIYAPAFLLAALTFFAFCSLDKDNIGTLFAVLASTLWGGYIGGSVEVFRLVPAGLSGGAFYMLTLRSQKEEIVSDPGSMNRIMAKTEKTRDRFRDISEAFSSLSEVFYNLSDRFKRPGTLDLRRICDSSFDEFCTQCPNRTVCWGLEYENSLDYVNSLISQLHKHGLVDGKPQQGGSIEECDYSEEILGKINENCARLTGELLRNNRAEILADDYGAIAAIIRDALDEEDGEYRFDSEMESKIRDYLKDVRISAGKVSVYGNRRRRILLHGVNIENSKVTAETLRADFGEMCGLELSSPVLEMEKGTCTMTLQSKRKIAVIGAQNNVSADGGVSGDSLNLFTNKQDYSYALVSDGMGSGDKAAETSNLCSVFLEKMLRAGNRAVTSLRMLNHLIGSSRAGSSEECSSTVDLLEMDLMTANVAFIKSGAAPSYILRNGVVHTVRAGTAPIGIIRNLDATVTRTVLQPGDTVVMISDGILEHDPECKWLTSYLTGCCDATPEEIVYHICLHAASEAKHDDCSAIAVRIVEEKK